MKVLFLLSSILLASCSHHHKESKHHHHGDDKCANCATKNSSAAFEHMCAYSVSEGDVHVPGKKEFRIEHGGETYYFSTKERLESFQKDMDKNVSAANSQWRMRGKGK